MYAMYKQVFSLSVKTIANINVALLFALTSMLATGQMLQNAGTRTCVYGDCENGRGTLEVETPFGKAIYRGSFEESEFHGQGRLEEPISFVAEAVYDGGWNRGVRNGSGKYWNGKGNLYIGQWLNNKRHGFGTYIFGLADWKENQHTEYWLRDNTENYSGEFVNDLYQGQGTFRWPNGSKYVGGFFANDKHGQGIFYYETGTMRRQTWNYGDFVN